MAANSYKFKPNEKTLKERFPSGYTVKTTGNKKKKNRRWIVTPKAGGAGGPGTPALDPNAPDPSDPFGINKMAKPTLDRLDRSSAAHQQWAGDVRKWTESSLQNIYNAREAANNAYVSRMGQAGAIGNNGNAPVVAGSTGAGGTGGVTDPNQAATNANAEYSKEMDKAQIALANLQGRTDNANQLNYIAQHLKGYDYYASQIPSLYNDAKQKYTDQLTSAVMDLESKKEIAQIGADARMYSAQQQLLGSLAGVQGANSRNLVTSMSGMYNGDQRNATNAAIATQNNQTRREVAQISASAAWQRLMQQQKAARGKGAQKSLEFEAKQWDSFFNGTAVEIQGGGRFYYDNSGKLLPGAVPAASEQLASGDPTKAAAAARRWFAIASRLKIPKKRAAIMINNQLPASMDANTRRQILGAAAFGLL